MERRALTLRLAQATTRLIGMGKSGNIPEPAVRRLSLYLRQLESLLARKRKTVSSRQLGEALGLSDTQVRKDFAYFGQFGHPGIGYRVEELIARVRRILGTDKVWKVLLVGMGNLGRALVSYRGFSKKGFRVVAAFDSDERIVGTAVGATEELVVQPMSELAATIGKRNIRLAILAIPADSAPDVARQVQRAGVRGILNFAPVTLHEADCAVAEVDLAVHLEQLSFRLASDET